MERHRISRIAHTHHPIAAPLDDATVRRLLDRALRRGDEHVLDLGCGEGAWLLRALAGRPGVTAEGVDLDVDALAKAAREAAALGVGDRLTLHDRDAAGFASPQPFDVVLSVGAAHAFGGLMPTLAAARAHLAPGGIALVGDGFWEREPTPDLVKEVGEYEDLPCTVDRIAEAGWTPVLAHVSTLREWDDYEWSWTGSLAEWALDHPGDSESAAALEAAAVHRAGWLRGYRGTLGFVTLLLRRTSS
ncbi:methyltransferase domain-containing protein [Streptomyces sp. ME01-24h]|nr:methyltransferase domain-containing protein [Streptomyces sp. ME19-03-3]MDX3355040.1 methyltransferase domain-containing protein [Streptomyces sp. ME01-24h]